MIERTPGSVAVREWPSGQTLDRSRPFVYNQWKHICQPTGYTKMTEKRKKTSIITIRAEPHLKAAAEKAAMDDHRSLTQLVEKLLSDYLREKGYLK